MEAIENVIDAWLIEKFTEQMGSSSAYTNTKLVQIETAILRTPKDWEAWNFPAMAISNRLVERDAGMHPLRLEKSITYLLTFVTNDTEGAAIVKSRTLLTRAERALLALHGSLNGIVNDYGERAKQLLFYKSPQSPHAGASRLRKYSDPKNASKWFVAQDISIVINTITGVS
jgi:hypothetical protein